MPHQESQNNRQGEQSTSPDVAPAVAPVPAFRGTGGEPAPIELLWPQRRAWQRDENEL